MAISRTSPDYLFKAGFTFQTRCPDRLIFRTKYEGMCGVVLLTNRRYVFPSKSYETEDDAEAAMRANKGLELDGRIVALDFAPFGGFHNGRGGTGHQRQQPMSGYGYGAPPAPYHQPGRHPSGGFHPNHGGMHGMYGGGGYPGGGYQAPPAAAQPPAQKPAADWAQYQQQLAMYQAYQAQQQAYASQQAPGVGYSAPPPP